MPKPDVLSVLSSHSHVLLDHRATVHVQLDVTGPPAKATQARTPVDAVFVIDCSGSMGLGPRSPREHAFAATRDGLRRLDTADRSAIVVYDDTFRVLAPLSRDHAAAAASLAHVAMGGLTALDDALGAGIDALPAVEAGRNQRVFLLSDGQANQGETRIAVIAARAAKAAKRGVRVSTFGLGPDFNEELMEAIAAAGQGTYHYLESAVDAQRAFQAEIGALLATTIKDAELVIAPSAGAKVKRLVGLDATHSPVSVGDLAAHETRTLIVECALSKQAVAGQRPLVEVTLHYRTANGKPKTVVHPVAVEVTADADAVTNGVNHTVLVKLAELDAAMAQAKAAEMADAGQFTDAQTLLRTTDQEMAAIAAQAPELAHLLTQKRGEVAANLSMVEDATSYDQASRKTIRHASYRTRNSRGG
jgi:Ca-activated chloride channel family protein